MSDSNGDHNGHADTHPVTFGDLPNMVLTTEAASSMLTDLHNDLPIKFGEYLLRTLGITATVKNLPKSRGR